MEKKRGYNHGICLFKLFFDLPLVAVIRIIKLCIVHVLEFGGWEEIIYDFL